LDVIAFETCGCLYAKDLDAATQAKINQEMGNCIVQSLEVHEGQFDDQFTVDVTNQLSLQQFSNRIGVRMGDLCPQVLLRKAAVEAPAPEPEPAKTAPVATVNIFEMAGTFKRIEGEDFFSVVVANEQGRELKFLWLHYFEGSNALVNDPSALTGKQVKVQYANTEIFSGRLADYTIRRELKGFEVVE
ncbi:MAG: hypothetical protein AAF798_15985, partial [Bacteroidota bacterium]